MIKRGKKCGKRGKCEKLELKRKRGKAKRKEGKFLNIVGHS